jgi:hypothetical protein
MATIWATMPGRRAGPRCQGAPCRYFRPISDNGILYFGEAISVSLQEVDDER